MAYLGKRRLFLGVCCALCSVDVFLARSKGWKILPILYEKRWQLKSPGQPWNENARLGEKTEQPTEIETIRPIGNRNLIAGEKSERGADAVNRRPIIQMIAQIMTELFLGPAADGNNDVLRFATLDPDE